MSTVPDYLPTSTPLASRRLRACAGECAWILLAALAASALLALFVLIAENRSGAPLLESMTQPLNLLRLAVMTGCLALWGHILRSARRPNSVGGASGNFE